MKKEKLIVKESKVYIKSANGKEVVVSNDAKYYMGLHREYFSIYKQNKTHPNSVYLLFLTSKCNLNCPICYIQTNKVSIKEMPIDYIKGFLKGWRNVRLTLFGGEPTVRKDLDELIRIISSSGNIPILATNGLKLVDINYLKRLKKAGLASIVFQFDGFDDDVYKVLRGKKLVRKKIKALDNIKIMSIPISLEFTLARNINEKELKKTIDYALKNNFVNQIVIRSYGHLGKKGLDIKNRFTIDEMIDLVSKDYPMITKKKIYEFQKFLFTLSVLFRINRCMNKHLYIIFQDGRTIHDFLDITGIQRLIKPSMSKVYALYILLKSFRLSNIFDYFNIFTKIFIQFLNGLQISFSDLPSEMLCIDFSVMCEPITFNKDIADSCFCGEIRLPDGILHNKRGHINRIRN